MSMFSRSRALIVRHTGRMLRAVLAVALMAAAMIAMAPVTPSLANQDIFKMTGEPCSSCHTAPVSNGVLNPHGEEFKAKFFSPVGTAQPATPQVVLPQCAAGFVLSGNVCVPLAGPTPRPAACKAPNVVCNGDAECCSGKCWLDNNTPPARCGDFSRPTPRPVMVTPPPVPLCASGFYPCKLNKGGRLDRNNPGCCLHVPGVPHAN